MRPSRLLLFVAWSAVCGAWIAAAPATLPNQPQSVKFAVIGDSGTGDREQYDVADQMVRVRERFPYELVIMAGDNFLGSQQPTDLHRKFDRPYGPLMRAGVLFHAALGNHDEPHTINHAGLGMGGRRYYTFARRHVRFFALDTNELDRQQLQWFAEALAASTESWKVAFFHHPLYSNGGRHGSNVDIRLRLEPLLLKYGVNVVFSGHDHFYERLTPQKGIQYFVIGASGRLRKGDIQRSATTASGFDQDQSFLVAEVVDGAMHFEAISRTGARIDEGIIRHRETTP